MNELSISLLYELFGFDRNSAKINLQKADSVHAFQQMLSEASEVNGISKAELILKSIYPDMVYNVADTSRFKHWRRLDFPASKLFEENIDEDALASWVPKTKYASGFEPWV